MREIICDCCNKRLTYDECYAVPSRDQSSERGLDRLEEWIHVLPGLVSRIVCREDYDDYLDIVANQLAKSDKVEFKDIPVPLKEKAYFAARRRAQAYLNGDINGSPIGPFTPSAKGTGCFIATACYGSPDSAEVLQLRAFRDDVLLHSTLGTWVVLKYYRHSPVLAGWLSTHPACRNLARLFVVGPSVWLVARFRH